MAGWEEVNSEGHQRNGLLEQLPCEITICILSFLDWRDVIQCCSVSSTLRMCARDNLLWKQLYINQFPSDRYSNSNTSISSPLISLFENNHLPQHNDQDVDSQLTETTRTREKHPSILGEEETMEVGHWQRAFSIRYSCHKRWLNGQQVPDHSYTVDLDSTAAVTSLGLIPGSNTLIIGGFKRAKGSNSVTLDKLELPPLFAIKTLGVEKSECPSPKRYKLSALSSSQLSSITLDNTSRIEGIVCSENKIIALHAKSFSVITNGDFTTERKVECHSNKISCARVDGNVVVTGSWDRTLKIIDLHTGDIIGSIQAHTANIKDLVLTPELIISCSNDRHIKFFDRRSYSLVHDLQPEILGRSIGTCALALNTQVNKLAIALRQGQIVLCDYSLARHFKNLQMASYLPGTEALTSTAENFVRRLQMDEHKVLGLQSAREGVWDMQRGNLCFESKPPLFRSYVDALFDDTRLFTATGNAVSVVSFL
jgi:WD40 repeat protein